ncbi:HAD family phosphatase [Aliishimia ponticola]|uniref:HAD family phosphatase n=1 Tax=Aliishimia ponticola TaxID=2499833 RepID=A0A4V6S206_9RHOB|nr:HAD family phosphatase [Aliishimia ponticola]THH35253.1 HAD family phosphatase [Aliishimia ponticola]
MTIKAVIFDIGNVLIEWQPERFYDAQIGEDRRRAMFAEADLHGMNELVDQGHPFTETIYAHAEKHPEWRDEIRMWHDRWLDLATPVIDHSVRLMRALQARGIPVFSLTNFGIESYDYAAQHFPFLREFDRDFISGHMKVTKPDARIYQMVEEGAGLSGPELLFTDDRPDNIFAASERGWHTHQFTGPEGWAKRLVGEGLLPEEDAR